MTIVIRHLPPEIALVDETNRLEDLRALEILDSGNDASLDSLAEVIAKSLDTPMAAISFIDEDRQWFKAKYGLHIDEMPREQSFCNFAIQEPDGMVIPDATKDRRFASNPFVIGEPRLRFYAGAPIRSRSGRPIGTCCALGTEARQLSEPQRQILHQIAKVVEVQLTLGQDVEKLKIESNIDTATGLPNVSLFSARLDTEIERAREESSRLLVALIRIDRFDAFDAALGREAATYLVSALAGRIRERVDPPCHLGHTQEDRLALLTPLSDKKDPQQVMRSLMECVASPFQLGEHAVPVGISIGASIFPDDAAEGPILLKRARTALWSRPSTKKSGYEFYQTRHSDMASGEFRITTALQNALENGEFHLVFQPKIDIQQTVLVGAEALLRWNSRTLGPVSPAKFVPVAEKSDKIIEIGNWVLLEACRQMADWHANGCRLREVAVNVTSHQIRQPGFVGLVRDALDRHGLPRDCLNIELTESSLVDDLAGAVRIMHQLRGLGVKISIDDFGTGFSSLSYLRRMPIQVLKIDRSFIRKIPEDRDDMKLVRSIVSLGHELELDIVAEGAETEAQLAFLESIGCDQVQGYVLSRPLEVQDLQTYVSEFVESAPLGTALSAPGSGGRAPA